jgi:hypothetical protein
MKITGSRQNLITKAPPDHKKGMQTNSLVEYSGMLLIDDNQLSGEQHLSPGDNDYTIIDRLHSSVSKIYEHSESRADLMLFS